MHNPYFTILFVCFRIFSGIGLLLSFFIFCNKKISDSPKPEIFLISKSFR